MRKMILMLAFAGVCESFAQDTIQVELNEKAKVMITAQDRESLRQLKNVNFNKLIWGAIDKVDSVEKKSRTYIAFGNDFEDEEGLIVVGSEKRNKKKKQAISNDFVIDLGLNNYIDRNGSFPDATNASYRLQTASSIYVGIGEMWYFRVGGEKSPVSIRTGLMFDWYNFRFVPDNYIGTDANGVVFGNYLQDFGKKIDKAKLVVPYVQIPLMLRFKVPVSEKVSLRAGVGGYVALRTGGRSKINVEGNKIKDKDSYYLNTWRYGLEGNIGINNFTIFAKYDLNPLFAEGKAPQLNPISFGIRL
ncbi:MAG: outer membrane beta-barrel protein [Thermonemataceae bacterium]|nr:outer membrane beta-barrel protein [Thermonemataceae bacterium]